MSNTKSEDEPAVDIRCPRCNSDKITVCENIHGNFEVVQCYNCNYTKECDLKDKR